ncbi:Vascular endothelial growth factor receptor 2 [Stylophora pistillata]|uniref:Vascular endothelial growth factor receptor 2 n=1 Tax=Stylophora pistillata TaxID=50429 RepID=A0A2B4R8S4_STYPI|nr:Vascular endothelial growth factor receptor 2 [Stylophora pistillata]
MLRLRQYAVPNDTDKICESTSCTKCLRPCKFVFLERSESQCLQNCVFTSPHATLRTAVELCGGLRAISRQTFQGIFFKLKVAVVTENSSISNGEKTNTISLPQPAPISDLALISLVYDGDQYQSNRIKLMANWTQSKPEQELISDHLMVWEYECFLENGVKRRWDNTKSADPIGTVARNDELKKCHNTLKVYAMSQCIQSNATSITFEYPVDPPGSPEKDRKVRNLSSSLIAIEDGFRFTAKLTWLPPLYPHKTVEYYFIFGYGATTVWTIFKDDAPPSADNTILISTPGPDPSHIKVQTLVFESFVLLPQTGQFRLNVSWKKPLFNYSQVLCYTVSSKIDDGDQNVSQTNRTYLITHGISYGEPVTVTPHFINGIEGKSTTETFSAPGCDDNVDDHGDDDDDDNVDDDDHTCLVCIPLVPPDGELMVQNLNTVGKFVEREQSNTFAVNISWEPPSFKYRHVSYYNVSCHFHGYPRDEFRSYTKTNLQRTTFRVAGILPQQRVNTEIIPFYNDKYITGKSKRIEDTAPGPRTDLVKVIGLRHNELMPSSDESFRMTVFWQKPLFNHSVVQYYRYRISNTSSETVGKKKRRAIDLNTDLTTESNNVTIDGIQMDEKLEFKVIPVFEVSTIMGQEDRILITSLSRPVPHHVPMAPGEIIALVIGSLLLILIALSLIIWCHKERQRRRKAEGLIPGKVGLMIDQWEVDPDRVNLEEEIDEGAFGKVFKGILKGPCTPSLNSTFKASRTIKGDNLCTVAVKMLHDMGDSDQRRDFLDEIQLMKDVGSHRNIVNMVGCCTMQEPMFLLLEYVPCGSLLKYLRKHRGKMKENIGETPRGPYHSTYCETYTTNAGISIKATKSDRIYVNAPGRQQEQTENIQLVSFSSQDPENKNGEENRGMNKDERDEEHNEDEESLTPGDLMAFAWQISQAMEYLAKKGFIHRDLAARNVLVGENKSAKVADFGLTRHVYEERVYQGKTNRKLPLKWMSIEAIFDQTFTTHSDVWSFGVVLWELVTLGGTPYPTIDNKELLRTLKDGYRMEQPDTCDNELYEVMMDCWRENPDQRPGFTQLRNRFESMMQKDNPYMDFSAVDETSAYYSVPSFNSIMDESPDEDNGSDSIVKERRQSSTDSVELTDHQNVEPLSGDVKEISEQKGSQNNITQDGEQDHFSEIKIPNDVKTDTEINLDELQMSFYRPAKRITAF